MNMKRLFESPRNRLLAVAAAGALALAGSAFAFSQVAKDKAETAKITVPLDETPVPRESLPTGSYAPIVKKVVPGVVKIETSATIERTGTQQFPDSDDPFWRHFFGDQFGRLFPRNELGPRTVHGLGSGVVITKDGYILTNNHVVDGAKEVKVTMEDGHEYTAKVIGRDPKTDLAVVKRSEERRVGKE